MPQTFNNGDTVIITSGIHNVGQIATVVNACDWLTSQGGVTLSVNSEANYSRSLQWAKFSEIQPFSSLSLQDELERILSQLI